MAAQPSVSISLAGRVGYLFDPPTILQGFVCHTKGVALTSRSNVRIEARVKGKRTHALALTSKNGALEVECSCPARSYGQSYCKHLWAALLEIDRHGGLDDLRTTRAPLEVVVGEPTVNVAPHEVAPPAPASPPQPAAKKRKAKKKKAA